jgi:hypothetical protein
VRNGGLISNRGRFDLHPRVLNDTPCFAAITLVAPGERFNALAILVTPCLSLAIVLNLRKSSFDHARRTTFFFFISVPFFENRACNTASTFSNARCHW